MRGILSVLGLLAMFSVLYHQRSYSFCTVMCNENTCKCIQDKALYSLTIMCRKSFRNQLLKECILKYVVLSFRL